ncbi:hypothetical protein BH09SUM1_BH09SUM1_27640 [soil metagenome]
MINRILINREECEVRVAFMDGPTAVELHTEKFDHQTIVNNIYRGRVQDVVPGLQAAFVDVGLERNMFLHFMDIRPESLVLGDQDQIDSLRKASEVATPGRIERRGRRPRQDPRSAQAAAPVKKGDQIIVQVVKDEIGGKAPRVTTNLSFAGRYLVLLPFPSQEGGVSRKIAVGQDRFRLKKLLSDLRSDDHAFIVRTAGMDQDDDAIRKDAESLQSTWDAILKKYKRINGPGLIHNDHNLLARLVRDAFPADFEDVICDDEDDAEQVRVQLQEHMPTAANRVKLYKGLENIFERYGVEKQIEMAMARKFWLKSGGYLIIDENEALTAIDVNTGRFTGKKDQEKTSLKTNLEACEAIAQMIRLRDIGGIIVVDFIDMLSRGHQEKVSDELKRALRHDRAKTAIGRIGDFGLMMLTRKRQRMSLLNQLYLECPYCKATGWILNDDEIFRKMKYEIKKAVAGDKTIGGVLLSAHPTFIEALQKRFRNYQDILRNQHDVEIIYRPNSDFHREDFQIAPISRGQSAALRLPTVRVEEGKNRVPAITDKSLLLSLIPDGANDPLMDPEDREFEEAMGAPTHHRHDHAAEYADDEEEVSPLKAQADEFVQQPEPLDEEDESDEPAAAAGTAFIPEGPVELTTNSRFKRRRESSSQRRARRKRMEEAERLAAGGTGPAPISDGDDQDDDDDLYEDEQQPAAVAYSQPAAPVPVAYSRPAPAPQQSRGVDWVNRLIGPAINSQPPVPEPVKIAAPLRPAAAVPVPAAPVLDDDYETDEEEELAAHHVDSPVEGEDPNGRRRTRRGKRGGRRRRREGEEDDVVSPVPSAASSQPISVVPIPEPLTVAYKGPADSSMTAQTELPKLKLKLPSRKPQGDIDLLAGVLEQVEREVKTLQKTPVAHKQAPPTPPADLRPIARKSRRGRDVETDFHAPPDDLEEVMEIKEALVEEPTPDSKPARSKRLPTRRNSPALAPAKPVAKAKAPVKKKPAAAPPAKKAAAKPAPKKAVKSAKPAPPAAKGRKK